MAESFDIIIRDRIAVSISAKLKVIEQRAQSTTVSLTRMQRVLNSLRSNLGLNAVGRQFSMWSTGLKKTNTQLQTMTAGLAKAGVIARRLVTGAFLIQGTGYLTEALDSYQTLQNRLRDVATVKDAQGVADLAQSTERLNELTRQLFEVADRARVPVSSLAKTYRRLDNALKQTGASQQESMRITETAGKLLSLSGANAGEAASALLQLSQAFNKGKLDGDEFRSVAELMPQTIDAIAKRLGIARKEIFDYSEAGAITVDILRGAFKDLATEVDESFTRLPRTIGQAFTQLVNTITQAFGSSSNASSFTSMIINGIDWIKNNLPTVIRLIKTLVATMAVNTVFDFFLNFGNGKGIIQNFTGALSLLIPYFIYFSDQITVTKDGLVTLHDVLVGIWGTIRELLTGKTGSGSLLGDIFHPAFAQEMFTWIKDGLTPAFMGLVDAIKGTVSVLYGLYEAWKGLSWKDLALLMYEPFEIFLQSIVVWGLQIGVQLAKIAEDVVNNFTNAIFDGLARLIQSLKAFFGSSGGQGVAAGAGLGSVLFGPNYEKMLDNASEAIAGEKNSKVNFGIADGMQRELEKAQMKLATMAPTWDRAVATFNKGYESQMEYMDKEFSWFADSVMEKARANADFRIAEEKRVQKAMTANPDALRQRNYRQELLNKVVKPAEKKKEEKEKEAAPVLFFGRGARGRTQDLEARRAAREASDHVNLYRGTLQQVYPVIKQTSASVTEMAAEIKKTPFNESAAQATNYANIVEQQMTRVNSAVTGTGYVIKNSQVEAWMAAVGAVNFYADTVVRRMAQVNGATGGQQNLQGPTVSDGRLQWNDGRGSLTEFSRGGYTGNGSRSSVAGVVHGQEFVMPAHATRQHRGELEAMRNGTYGGGSGGVTVNIENYGSSTHEVQQIGPNEVRIIAREEATQAFAHGMSNANSTVGRAMRKNTKSRRRN